VYVSFLILSVIKVCFESLRNVFVPSDNQFCFKRDLSSSHAIHTVKSAVVNEYCGILSGPPFSRNHVCNSLYATSSSYDCANHLRPVIQIYHNHYIVNAAAAAGSISVNDAVFHLFTAHRLAQQDSMTLY